MRHVGRPATSLDQRLVDRMATVESPLLDRVVPRLSEAANFGRLWLGVAAVLTATGRRDAGRAAARGLASLALASLAANVVAKTAVARARPATGLVPSARRLRRTPVTTSFPSGHSASAVAFACGASAELPILAMPLGALAAAV
ncbi:MAG: phosphatase PAP2 family protein, partial [Sporichthyaceae bacterium]|nr:phosphatase PAP2 family protein [Sporichthyaceae bacterium]